MSGLILLMSRLFHFWCHDSYFLSHIILLMSHLIILMSHFITDNIPCLLVSYLECHVAYSYDVTSQVSCIDNNVYCEDWAKSGECNKNPDYMNIYCPKVWGSFLTARALYAYVNVDLLPISKASQKGSANAKPCGMQVKGRGSQEKEWGKF